MNTLDSDYVIVDPTTVRGFIQLVQARGLVAAIIATVREVRA